MILSYYVNEIRNIIRDNTDDSKLSDLLIERWINLQRSFWIKASADKENSLEDNVVQTISGLELEVVSASELGYLESENRFLATKINIPKMIEFKDRLALIDVRIPELAGYSINMVRRDDIKYVNNRRFNQNDIFGFFYNSKIYIKVPETNYKAALMAHISMDGVFENPRDLTNIYNGEKYCFDIDREDYPISDAIWEYISGNIIKFKVGIMQNTLPDESANERDE